MNRRSALALIMLLVSLIMLSSAQVHAQTAQQKVVVINLNEEIDPGSAHLIVQSLSGLNRNNTAAVIIDMNTPGGLLISMLQMVNAINATEAAGVPVYTYIPTDGMGASAGSYVAMASDVIAMGNGSYIGPSTPIVVGGSQLQQNHTEAAMQALMVSMASSHDRNTTAAALMVSTNTAYDAKTAVHIGIADKLSDSINAFIKSENLSAYQVQTFNPSIYDNFISFLSNAYVDGIMILLGAIALMADIYHGTIVLSVAGVALLALGFLGAEIISASVVGILLLIIGIALIFVELKTGHGLSLLAGVGVGLVGTFLLAAPYASSNPGYSPSPFGSVDYIATVIIIILAVLLAVFFRYIFKSLRRRSYTGSESLIGKEGTVKKELSPKGWISVEGVMWEAESDTGKAINVGDNVVIISIDGLTLRVKKV